MTDKADARTYHSASVRNKRQIVGARVESKRSAFRTQPPHDHLFDDPSGRCRERGALTTIVTMPIEARLPLPTRDGQYTSRSGRAFVSGYGNAAGWPTRRSRSGSAITPQGRASDSPYIPIGLADMALGQNRPPVASQTFPESFPRPAENAAPFTRTPRVPPPAHSRPLPAIATQPLPPMADKGERACSATERFGRAVPGYGSRSAPNHHIRPRHAPYRAEQRSIDAAATDGLSERSKAKRPLTNLPALQPENPPHRVLIKPWKMRRHPVAERRRRLKQRLDHLSPSPDREWNFFAQRRTTTASPYVPAPLIRHSHGSFMPCRFVRRAFSKPRPAFAAQFSITADDRS
ncbi:hypothetical protein BTI_4285 [Burkholderia thailandensis MSMB121]|uniref:hypothetical protein n=1 Tax=Burkholderia humptydooensis TaxID=430531 RepID=UPI000327F33E|nr:hypothetical protein [Burkholderia humptydooensis]AGK51485.1 hypothetical protein BTI_4285 [Burkholderia thailandensis MSMB121]